MLYEHKNRVHGRPTWRAMNATHKVTWTVGSNGQERDIERTKPLPNLRKGRTHRQVLWKIENITNCELFGWSSWNFLKETGMNEMRNRFQIRSHDLHSTVSKSRSYAMVHGGILFLVHCIKLNSRLTFLPVKNWFPGTYITPWVLTALFHSTISCVASKI